jgi:hypothetical protein
MHPGKQIMAVVQIFKRMLTPKIPPEGFTLKMPPDKENIA